MIDLDNNRFEIIGEHNIESQYMEAHSSLILLRLAILVLVSNIGYSTDYRFNNSIFYTSFQILHIHTTLC